MTNGDELAYPLFDGQIAAIGLTKREYFAAMALQGLMAVNQKGEGNVNEVMQRGAEYAVIAADALIAALNEKEVSHD